MQYNDIDLKPTKLLTKKLVPAGLTLLLLLLLVSRREDTIYQQCVSSLRHILSEQQALNMLISAIYQFRTKSNKVSINRPEKYY